MFQVDKPLLQYSHIIPGIFLNKQTRVTTGSSSSREGSKDPSGLDAEDVGPIGTSDWGGSWDDDAWVAWSRRRHGCCCSADWERPGGPSGGGGWSGGRGSCGSGWGSWCGSWENCGGGWSGGWGPWGCRGAIGLHNAAGADLGLGLASDDFIQSGFIKKHFPSQEHLLGLCQNF